MFMQLWHTFHVIVFVYLTECFVLPTKSPTNPNDKFVHCECNPTSTTTKKSYNFTQQSDSLHQIFHFSYHFHSFRYLTLFIWFLLCSPSGFRNLHYHYHLLSGITIVFFINDNNNLRKRSTKMKSDQKRATQNVYKLFFK